MRNYRKGSHTVHDLRVHLVWIPKYRKPVLTGAVGLFVRDVLRQECTRNDWEIVSGKVAPDHVHLYLSYPPISATSKIVQTLKGKSSYKVFSEFPHVRKTYWGRHFWARGYLAVSSGNVTDEVIRRYIDGQEGEDISHGPFDVSG